MMLICLLVTTRLAAQSAETKVEAIMARELAAGRLVGASVAVLKYGVPIYTQGFGFADAEHKVAADANTVYKLGSLTKQFTATVAMQLVEEKRIKLDAPVYTYLPDLPNSWRKITVRNLLTHTSGIPNYTDILGFAFKLREHGSDDKVIQFVGTKLDFAPGSQWKYSNTGYIVLGKLISHVEKKPFADVLKTRILTPLQMNSTATLRMQSKPTKIAQGYASPGKKAMLLDDGWPGAAGDMVSTAIDMAKWLGALERLKVLSSAASRQMWAPTILTTGASTPYGFGWTLGEIATIPTISHNGAIPGFSTADLIVQQKHLDVVVLTNSDTGPAETLAKEIAKAFEPSLAVAPKAILDNDPKRSTAERKLLDDVIAGTVDVSRLSPELKKAMSPSVVESVSKSLKSLGAVKSLILVREVPSPGQPTIREYAIQFEATTVKYIVGYDAKGIITVLGFRPE